MTVTSTPLYMCVRLVIVMRRRELEIMLREGIKAEIQALSSCGLGFLSDHYLPQKISEGAWL